MENKTYKDFWNSQASSPESAISAVDGSQSEDVVQHTGRWSAEQVRAALDIGPDDRVLELGCGIGRIGRRLTVQLQQRYHHVLDLLLAGRACANHRQLDLAGRVLVDLDVVPKRRTEGRRPRMAELQRAARILGHKHALDGDDIGPVLVDDVAHAGKDVLQALRE